MNVLKISVCSLKEIALAASSCVMLVSTTADAASFRCEEASSPVEQLICGDATLSAQDETIASLYRDLRLGDSSDELLRDQRAWLDERNRCTTSACLYDAYQGRLSALNAAMLAQSQPAVAPVTAGENVDDVTGEAATETIPVAPPRQPAATDNDRSGQSIATQSTSQVATDDADISGEAILLMLLTGVGGWWFLVQRGRQKQHREAFAIVNSVISEHAKTLAARRRQLIVVDPYGTANEKAWHKEALHFYNTKISPKLTDRHRTKIEIFGPTALIEYGLSAHGIDLNDLNPTFKSNDAVQYEHHCAEMLRQAGWTARVTKGSGDQGSDVIAERESVTLVLQCKLYAYPVGNKAVQEVAAARAHERADFAACVTNSTYTPSAKSLAVTNSVALLHHDQLADWADGLLASRS